MDKILVTHTEFSMSDLQVDLIASPQLHDPRFPDVVVVASFVPIQHFMVQTVVLVDINHGPTSFIARNAWEGERIDSADGGREPPIEFIESIALVDLHSIVSNLAFNVMSQTVLPRSSFHSREDNLVLNPPEFMAQLINLIFETLKKLGIFIFFLREPCLQGLALAYSSNSLALGGFRFFEYVAHISSNTQIFVVL